MGRGLLVVVSGPSGAGKGTICRAIHSQYKDLYYSVSVTTRLPRSGERDGVDYFFVSPLTFKEMLERGEFLEWARVYDHYYGTPKRAVDEALAQGRDVLLEIDVQGALQLKKKMMAGELDRGVFVFVTAPNREQLRARIIGRGTEDPGTIEKRVQAASMELQHMKEYDYIIINDSLPEAIDRFRSILVAEKSRSHRILRDLNLLEEELYDRSTN
ncbi:MAG: guanylate kinase [Clostridia bacterium]|nr:guanylate kinase [Clostridia bacterium]